jgi:hypothetical protein
MCFAVRYNLRQAFTLPTHTLCWKALYLKDNKGAHSPYQRMPYIFGQRYTAPLCKQPPHYKAITRGLHSYSKNLKADVRTHQQRFIPGTLYPAIIPAGSRFYYDDYRHELVSEALVVFRTMHALLATTGQTKVQHAIRLPRIV